MSLRSIFLDLFCLSFARNSRLLETNFLSGALHLSLDVLVILVTAADQQTTPFQELRKKVQNINGFDNFAVKFHACSKYATSDIRPPIQEKQLASDENINLLAACTTDHVMCAWHITLVSIFVCSVFQSYFLL